MVVLGRPLTARDGLGTSSRSRIGSLRIGGAVCSLCVVLVPRKDTSNRSIALIVEEVRRTRTSVSIEVPKEILWYCRKKW